MGSDGGDLDLGGRGLGWGRRIRMRGSWGIRFIERFLVFWSVGVVDGVV